MMKFIILIFLLFFWVLEIANTFLFLITSMQAPAFIRELCRYDKKPCTTQVQVFEMVHYLYRLLCNL